MSNESLLRDLVRVAREQEAEEGPWLDERWNRLFAGELPPEEEAALGALAAESEGGLATFEAFRPLGPDFAARAVEAIEKQKEAPPEPEPEPGPAPPVPKARSLRRRMGKVGSRLAAAAVSLAAALAAVLLYTPADLPAMVQYDLAMSGDVPNRSADSPEAVDKVAVLAPRSHFLVQVQQVDKRVSGRVEARCFLKKQGGKLLPWDDCTHLLRNTEDNFELDEIVAEGIKLEPGAYRLVVVVGRAGKEPTEAELRPLLSIKTKLQTHDWFAMAHDFKITVG
jgi:hypothetical protein